MGYLEETFILKVCWVLQLVKFYNGLLFNLALYYCFLTKNQTSSLQSFSVTTLIASLMMSNDDDGYAGVFVSRLYILYLKFRMDAIT